MGYATVLNVPRVLNYTQAKQIVTTTKPIRGTTIIPLGNRRDHHQYSIRKEGEDVQLVCYKTPVVTFHASEDVTIRTDGWNSVSTHQFIQQILGIPAYGRGRLTVLDVGGGKVTIEGSEAVSFKRGEDGGWQCLSSIVRPSYRMNRKGANNVRARYREFADYLKGFSKVRAETVKPQWSSEYKAIKFSMDELETVFPRDADGDIVWVGTSHLMQRGSKNYVCRGEQMIGWVTSGDHEQYFKAALHLYAPEHGAYVSERQFKSYYNNPLLRPFDKGPKKFDEFILRWHAEEVIETCETKPNAVPNMKYADWLVPKQTDKA